MSLDQSCLLVYRDGLGLLSSSPLVRSPLILTPVFVYRIAIQEERAHLESMLPVKVYMVYSTEPGFMGYVHS